MKTNQICVSAPHYCPDTIHQLHGNGKLGMGRYILYMVLADSNNAMASLHHHHLVLETHTTQR